MAIRTDRDQGVLTVRIDRPEALNSVDEGTLQELQEALDGGMGSRKVGAILVEGAGDAFCTGADLRVFQDAAETERVQHVVGRVSGAMNDVIETLALGPKPVVACVDGVAAGGGMGLALACDLRFASPQARFVPGFPGLGLAPDAGTSWFLPRMVGTAQAAQVLLGDQELDADELEAWGLVQGVYEAGKAREQAFERAAWLAAQPGDAVAWTKRHLSEPNPFREHLSRERTGIVETANTDAFRERLAAFFDA